MLVDSFNQNIFNLILNILNVTVISYPYRPAPLDLPPPSAGKVHQSATCRNIAQVSPRHVLQTSMSAMACSAIMERSETELLMDRHYLRL